MKYCLSALIAVIFVYSAAAQPAAEDDAKYLQNQQGVMKLLRINGVDPTLTRWNEIEQICQPLVGSGKEIYNRCRYEHAHDQFTFNGDVRVCNDAAKAEYPDVLKQPNTETVIDQSTSTSTSDKVKATTTTITRPGLLPDDIRAKRQTAYNQCMDGRGWRDPHNYMLGQSR